MLCHLNDFYMTKKLTLFFALLFPMTMQAQWKYPSYSQLQISIDDLAKHPLVNKVSIGQSYGKEDISILKFGQKNSNHPVLMIVAGIDGLHPAGTINALAVGKNLLALTPDSLNNLLANKSIWILPLANPDAYKRNATSSLYFTSGNARKIDNDRDGRIDEDPAKDLNGDGIISQMRVKSLVGTYRVHPDFPDYLLKADLSKGESGSYELYTEGVDSDQDGMYGEDGASGVNIDRNFTFDYGAFESETGDYAASEPETRALLNVIYENPNIATILHFGLQNNLSVAESFDGNKANTRITASWTSNDVEVSNLLTHYYNESTKKLGSAPKASPTKGNFSSTAYYHAGRFSFVTPTWWTPTAADSLKGKFHDNKIESANITDEKFIDWVYTNKIEGAILPWTKVTHPDFPTQEVEVGGVVEFYKNNPPLELLQESSAAHTDFVAKLLKSMATLVFSSPQVTSLGDDIFRVELKIYNTGSMPTYPEIGDKIRHVSKLKSVIEIQKSQQFLSGKRLQLYPALGAGKSQEFSWLIKGKGKVDITVGCPSAGEKTIAVTL